MNKVGIITFHNSYNCGSMLETYAMQESVRNYFEPEIVNYSSEGQKRLYSVLRKNNSIKNIAYNILSIPAVRRIAKNNEKYREFQKKFFKLSDNVSEEKISDADYAAVVAGSDQIWNITIADYNDVYFLNWVKNAKKIAYSPSFGAKNPAKHSKDINQIKEYLSDFDALSIREKNGQKWLADLGFKNVPVLLDPTLLLEQKDYKPLEDNECTPKEKYIFFYSPHFDKDMCSFVKKVAKKYGYKVITWSTRAYFIKAIWRFGFKLPKYENPSVYLSLIKNAELVFTTSYHGTIFSTIYRKKFFCLKNGGMYGDDDRVRTLLEQLNMMDRLIEYNFDDSFDYFSDVDYYKYEESIKPLKKKSQEYLEKSLKDVK